MAITIAHSSNTSESPKVRKSQSPKVRKSETRSLISYLPNTSALIMSLADNIDIS